MFGIQIEIGIAHWTGEREKTKTKSDSSTENRKLMLHIVSGLLYRTKFWHITFHDSETEAQW